MKDTTATAELRARGHPARGDPEVPELPVLGVDGPVRLRAVHQRRQLLLLRAQGPLAGDPAQGRPRAARRDPHDDATSRTARSRRRRSRCCSALNLDLRDEYVADCANGVRRWNQELEEAGLERAAVPAARGLQPPRRRLRAPPRQPRRRGARRRRPGTAARTAGCPTTRTAGGRRADGAGVRVRRVRRLDRAARRPGSTTSRSSSTTCTSPRKAWREVVELRPHLDPRGAPGLGRRQGARDRRRPGRRVRAAVRAR